MNNYLTKPPLPKGNQKFKKDDSYSPWLCVYYKNIFQNGYLPSCFIEPWELFSPSIKFFVTTNLHKEIT